MTPPSRMGAAMTSMAPTSAVSMSSIMRLLYNNHVFLFAPPNHTSKQTGDKEEYAIHNAKHPARLQHRACLIRTHMEARHTAAHVAETDRVGRARRGPGAVGVPDEAQLVDGSYECTDEAQIDEGDEKGVGLGAVVSEERCDRPDSAQDRNNEEDENVVRCERIVGGVDIHEV